jgi:hypothetical protein
MMKDPKKMEMMQKMMSSMPASMLSNAGVDPKMAEKMKSTLSSMKPEDMQRMMKMAMTMQKAKQALCGKYGQAFLVALLAIFIIWVMGYY